MGVGNPRQMIEAILEKTCPESLINDLKSIDILRFEQLVQIIQETLDPNLYLQILNQFYLFLSIH